MKFQRGGILGRTIISKQAQKWQNLPIPAPGPN